jgi:excisionase family DNA binding protein
VKTRRKPVGGLVVALPIPEAATAASVGEGTLRKAIASGDVSVAKVGRRSLVRLKEVERWLQSCEGGARTEGQAG